MKAGTGTYNSRRVDAGDVCPQAGDEDVAEDGLAGRDEDGGAKELENCAALVCARQAR